MNQDPAGKGSKLKILPLQYMELADGVILKRGRHEIKIGGPRASRVVQLVLGLTADGSATREEIAGQFAMPDRADVSALVEQLEARRFLVPANSPDAAHAVPESSLDVFYWHFGLVAERVNAGFKGRIVILGVNCISRQLASSLRAAGLDNLDVIHYPLLCNLRLLASDGSVSPEHWPSSLPRPLDYDIWKQDFDAQTLGCLVATSDFGGLGLMRPWNEFCVRAQRHFLPVVLQDLVGYVGPLVVPGETACFECLRARQNSNVADPDVARLPEERAFVEQATVGFHPSMASILGDLAALELARFYGQFAPPRIVGSLLEVSMLAPSIDVRKVLKVPRCRICSPMNRHAPTSPMRNIFLPGNEWPE